MPDDALPPILTAAIGPEIDPLIRKLGWSKADLGRFLQASRQTVSKWARGRSSVRERNKAAIRFVRKALEVEDPIFSSDFGEWALPLGIRGLVFKRLGVEPPFETAEGMEAAPEDLRGSGPLLGPEDIREIRRELGWIQAEMAAFFGVTHSTPAKWEKADPQVGPAAEAELIALREHASSSEAGESKMRELWKEGVNRFMTEILSWKSGIFPSS
jgi:DNA-binding transcriptional regulator YiaG